MPRPPSQSESRHTRHASRPRIRLRRADALKAIRRLKPDSLDALVTDPPYGLGFMGKDWDSFKATRPRPNSVLKGGGQAAVTWEPHAYQDWCLAWATECLRVLKPGGHLVAFGGTRTWHRLAVAIEDAGFEIRDTLLWLHGQGFPKSLDVSKAIARPSAVHRPPSTANWSGWGTALKPAVEPIILARKRLDGSVAANVLRHRTGGLNINACRIAMVEQDAIAINSMGGFGAAGYVHPPTVALQKNMKTEIKSSGSRAHSLGRWPANLVLSHSPDCRRVRRADPCPSDSESRVTRHASPALYACVPDCPVRMLDGQSGHLPGPGNLTPPTDSGFSCTPTFGKFAGCAKVGSFWGDKNGGGASRFYYVAKASRTEREAGPRGHLPCVRCGQLHSRQHIVHTAGHVAEKALCVGPLETKGADPTSYHPLDAAGHVAQPPSAVDVPSLAVIEANRKTRGYAWHVVRCLRNDHPTVKPLGLMRWLVRLVTPPGGTLLDPFAGSGTTLVAAALEGFDAIGFDTDQHYIAIARKRVRHAIKRPSTAARTRPEAAAL